MARCAAPLLLVSSLLAACDGNERGSSPCTEYKSTIDLAAPQVSFRNELMPIIDRRCAIASCHSGGGAGGGLTLPRGDAARSRASLVDVVAQQLPWMKRVAPGDPSQSYLMRKIDGDACIFDAQCVQKSCETTMPGDGMLLDVIDRDKFRRWIAQGAKEN